MKRNKKEKRVNNKNLRPIQLPTRNPPPSAPLNTQNPITNSKNVTINNIFTNHLAQKSLLITSLSPETINKKLKDFYASKLVIRRLFYPDIPISIEKCYISLSIVPGSEYQTQLNKFSSISADNHSGENLYEYNSNIYGQPQPLLIMPPEYIIPPNINFRLDVEFFPGMYNTHTQFLSPIVKVLILGAAGIGKSTLSEYFTYLWASSNVNALKKQGFINYEWVFRIPLRNITEDRYPNNRTYQAVDIIEKECLAKVFNEKEFFLSKKEKKDLETALHQSAACKKVLIILDGFDEFTDNASEHLRDLVKQFLSVESVIVTSRPYNLYALKHDYQFTEQHLFEITGFPSEEIKNYVNNFFSYLSIPKNQESEKVLNFLARNPNIAGACRIPINLELLCSAWEKHPPIGQNIYTVSSIYDFVVSSLCRRYLEKQDENVKNDRDMDSLKIVEKCFSPLGFLERLGCQSANDHRSFIKVSTTRAYVEGLEIKKQKDKISILTHQKLFGFIRPNNPTGEYDGASDYYFNHLTFRDFFAARYIAFCLQCVVKTSASKIAYFPHEWRDPDNSNDSLETFIRRFRFDNQYEYIWWFISGLLTNVRDAHTLKYFFGILFEEVDCIEISRVLLIIRCLDEAHEFTSRLFESVLRYLSQWIDAAITENEWEAILYATVWERLALSRSVFLTDDIQGIFRQKLENCSENMLRAVLNALQAIKQPLPNETNQRLLNRIFRVSRDGSLSGALVQRIANLCDQQILSIKYFDDIYRSKNTTDAHKFSVSIAVLCLASGYIKTNEFIEDIAALFFSESNSDSIRSAAAMIFKFDNYLEAARSLLNMQKQCPALLNDVLAVSFKHRERILYYLLSVSLDKTKPISLRLQACEQFLQIFVMLSPLPSIDEEILLLLFSAVQDLRLSLADRFLAYYLLVKFCDQFLHVFTDKVHALSDFLLIFIKDSELEKEKHRFLSLLSLVHPSGVLFIAKSDDLAAKILLFFKENFHHLASLSIRKYVSVYLCLNDDDISEASFIETANVVIANTYTKKEFLSLTAVYTKNPKGYMFVNAFCQKDCSAYLKHLHLGENTNILSLYYLLTKTAKPSILRYCLNSINALKTKYLIGAIVVHYMISGKALYFDDEGVRYFDRQKYQLLPLTEAQKMIFAQHIEWALKVITKMECPHALTQAMDRIMGRKVQKEKEAVAKNVVLAISSSHESIIQNSVYIESESRKHEKITIQQRRRTMEDVIYDEPRENPTISTNSPTSINPLTNPTILNINTETDMVSLSERPSELLQSWSLSALDTWKKQIQWYLEKDNQQAALSVVSGQPLDVIRKFSKDTLCQVDKYGNTLVHHAALFNRSELIPFLMSSGIGLSSKNKAGFCPIHMAVLANEFSILNEFLERGSFDNVFLCQLILPSKQPVTVKLDTLYAAITIGNRAMVKMLLNERTDAQLTIEKLSGNKTEIFCNVLFLAVHFDQAASLKELLEHTKTKGLLNDNIKIENLGLLSYAAAKGSAMCLEILLRHYARVGKDLSQNQEPLKALYCSVDYGNEEAVEILLYSGVNPQEVLEVYDCKATSKEYDDTPLIKLSKKLVDQKQVTLDKKSARERIKNLVLDKSKEWKEKKYRMPNLKAERIDNLVFQGGGVKGIAYVGVLQALDKILQEREKKQGESVGDFYGWRNVKRVAGTSAGAITAMGLALGLTTQDLQNYLIEAPFAQFLDDVDEKMLEKLVSTDNVDLLKTVLNLFNPNFLNVSSALHPFKTIKKTLGKEGICSGEKMLIWFRRVIRWQLEKIYQEEDVDNGSLRETIDGIREKCPPDQFGKPDLSYITFGDLSRLVAADTQKRFKHLYLVASALGTQERAPTLEIFNSEKGWEEVLVMDGVRASMSIPLIFVPYQVRRRNSKTGEITLHSHVFYVDGGMVKNYPIELFDRYQYMFDFAMGAVDKPVQNMHTLGFCLTEEKAAQGQKIIVSGKEGWFEREVDKILHAKGADFIVALLEFYEKAEGHIADFQNTRSGRTIEVTDCGVKTVQFNLTHTEKDKLVKSGFENTASYFEKKIAYQPLLIAAYTTKDLEVEYFIQKIDAIDGSHSAHVGELIEFKREKDKKVYYGIQLSDTNLFAWLPDGFCIKEIPEKKLSKKEKNKENAANTDMLHRLKIGIQCFVKCFYDVKDWNSKEFALLIVKGKCDHEKNTKLFNKKILESKEKLQVIKVDEPDLKMSIIVSETSQSAQYTDVFSKKESSKKTAPETNLNKTPNKAENVSLGK